ncbi:DUF4870 domain-containing protein [Paenibacillus agilis]|uniref:DUF4870 domain-containing protein n=1 Tax=Paenibacillus agilis TaxID=3020863 RepID=A0A559IHY4_9BACL|nr:DUF4870 domain-containing protein [Paenibacillus agilis]TVX87221.1 hypothetical protein FPZ44_22315 [Paenibacillus agilis]
MSSKHLLAALSYFSIFFAGVLLPLVVLFIADNSYTRKHAGYALISQLLPFVFIVFVFISLFGGEFVVSLGFTILAAILSFFIFVWNIIMGVKVLREAN